MAQLTIQAIQPGGISPTTVSAGASGDAVSLAAPNTWVEVTNGAASSITVTVTVQNPNYKGLTVPNRIVTVPASGTQRIGPFDPSLYGDVNNNAQIGYSAVASVTVGAFRI
jgi:hypothetical protein